MTKKQLIRLISFALLFSLCFLLLQSVLMSNSNNTRRMKGLYAEEENSLDVLYVGGSQVETFVSPVQIYTEHGITGYDLCFDGTSIELYKPLIDEALRLQKPKLLVISLVISATTSHEQSRAVLDNMRWSDNKRAAIHQYSEDSLSTFVFPMSYYHSRWKDLSAALGYSYFMIFENLNYRAFDSYSLYELYGRKVYPLKGFYTSDNVAANGAGAGWTMTEERLDPGEEYMEMLDGLIDYLNGLEIPYFFINTPSPAADSSDYQKMINFAGDHVRKRGCTYIDYCSVSKELGFDYARDMGDSVHANIHGAIKFGKALGDYMAENYALGKSPRSDIISQSWSKAVTVWENCVARYGTV